MKPIYILIQVEYRFQVLKRLNFHSDFSLFVSFFKYKICLKHYNFISVASISPFPKILLAKSFDLMEVRCNFTGGTPPRQTNTKSFRKSVGAVFERPSFTRIPTPTDYTHAPRTNVYEIFILNFISFNSTQKISFTKTLNHTFFKVFLFFPNADEDSSAEHHQTVVPHFATLERSRPKRNRRSAATENRRHYTVGASSERKVVGKTF